MNRVISRIAPWPLLAALVLLGNGCRENTVSFYQAPSEPLHTHGQETASAGSPADVRATAPVLEWTRPEGWTEKPPSPMRLASYGFVDPAGAEADVSVTSFPDAAGGLLANVNRWRGQVGLPPVDEAGLSAAAARAEIAGLPAWRVDFAGTPEGSAASGPTRIVGAIVPVAGTSWFFKMMGPEKVVASQRAAFDAFVGSIRAITPAPASVADDPHAGVPGAPPLAGAAAETGAAMDPTAVPPPPKQEGFAYETPPGWQPQRATQFRLASFVIPGPGVPAADVSVSAFPGMTGADLANVNRWRGQVGLGPIGEPEMDRAALRVEGHGLRFRVFDLESPNATLEGGRRSRILAAILSQGETTWFFKMTGESDHVAGQREAFLGFLRSFRFVNTP